MRSGAWRIGVMGIECFRHGTSIPLSYFAREL